jgi:ubiquinone/menaquinone biosynthesis C-methylase UbiE
MNTEAIRQHFDHIAAERDYWKQKNWYYYQDMEHYSSFVIPKGERVLEIGCGTGDLVASVKPSYGLGIDISPEMIKLARRKYPQLDFQVGNAEDLNIEEKFDYVILSDVIGYLDDIQQAFSQLKKVTTPRTRVMITYYNYLWEPVLRLGELLGLKMKQPLQNWLPLSEIQNILYLADFEVIKKGYRFLFPKYIPFFSTMMNKVIAKLPLINKLCLVEVLIAKQITKPQKPNNLTCSVIIPCRNEKGNIEGAVTRTPKLGRHTELIFVDGNSSDGTVEEIEAQQKKYKNMDIKLIHQGDGIGKGDAVRKGFAAASGDVLMILDSDLTVAPEDLPKFYNALVEGKGEFINGTRLVYQMEKQAMRLLNHLGNHFFSLAFTYLLEQRFRDTLCGTKVLLKSDYEKIAQNRSFFGDFDPFGDFDLIFGASKLNLKIIEVPIRYRERVYGSTKISRFSHGWLLLKMCVLAWKKLKFI